MNTVEKYTRCVDYITSLVKNGEVVVDPWKARVVLSTRVHLTFADDEFRISRWWVRLLMRMGLVRRNLRYVAFLDKVMAYINVLRALRKPEPMKPLLPEDRMDVFVSAPGDDGIFLIGFYQNNKLYLKYVNNASETATAL